MEPVPETESMEGFKPSPLPILRVPNFTNVNTTSKLSLPTLDIDSFTKSGTASSSSSGASGSIMPVKPQALRRSTEPSPSSPNSSSPWFSGGGSGPLPYRPRTTSPLSGHAAGVHSRSRSTASLAPPAMSRTQSMPGVNGAGQFLYAPHHHNHHHHHQQLTAMRPASPSGANSSSSPSRVRRPRRNVDEMFPPTSPVRTSVLEPSERRITERNSSPNLGVSSSSGPSPPSSSQQTITVLRHRRPASPLRQFGSASTGSLVGMSSGPGPSSTSSLAGASSPSQRSAEMFPSAVVGGGGYGGYGGSSNLMAVGGPMSLPPSSIPSTPTSTRSRSPSISSLETIPDSPDAEEAALEAERIAQLQQQAAAAAAAEAEAAENSENSDSSDSRSSSGSGRNSLEVPRGRTLGGFGSRDKRKRWSVCGAERRDDLNLETIWED